MTIRNLMQEIESPQFSARLNIANNLKTFLRATFSEEASQNLIKQLLDFPENRWPLFKRVAELSQKQIDTQYENPWDTALAVYIWALSLVHLEAAQTAADFSLQAENCWWARQVSSLFPSV